MGLQCAVLAKRRRPRHPLKPRIAVVTGTTENKFYAADEFIDSIHALKVPEGYEYYRVINLAGDYEEKTLKRIRSRFKGEILRGPEPQSYEDTTHPRNRIAAELRETIREHLLEQERIEWVLWLDSDVTIAPDTVIKLLDSGRPVASGIVFCRMSFMPFTLDLDVGFKVPPLLPEGSECDWTGFGCLLTRMDLVQALSWKPYLDKTEEPQEIGEDGYWCVKATKITGFRTWVASDVLPRHHAELFYVQGFWEDGKINKKLRSRGNKPTLISRQDGTTKAFGRVERGKPIENWWNGNPLTNEDKHSLAAESQWLELVEPE